jgi:hypothetical protein
MMATWISMPPLLSTIAEQRGTMNVIFGSTASQTITSPDLSQTNGGALASELANRVIFFSDAGLYFREKSSLYGAAILNP